MSSKTDPQWRVSLDAYLSSVTREERQATALQQANYSLKLIKDRLANNEISEGEAALEATCCCDFWGVSLPGWACSEIAKAWSLYKTGRPSRMEPLPDDPTTIFWKREPLPAAITLNVAFGVKPETRSRVAKAKEKEMGYMVHTLLKTLHYKGHPVDEGAFVIVGEVLAISGGQANKYYKNINKLIGGVTGKKTSSNEDVWVSTPTVEEMEKLYEKMKPFIFKRVK